MQNLKTLIKSNWSAATIVVKNLAEFVDAACLATVSGFAIYQVHFNKVHMSRFYGYVLLFAGFVIALQAFVLLVKHFNQPTK